MNALVDLLQSWADQCSAVFCTNGEVHISFWRKGKQYTLVGKQVFPPKEDKDAAKRRA